MTFAVSRSRRGKPLHVMLFVMAIWFGFRFAFWPHAVSQDIEDLLGGGMLADRADNTGMQSASADREPPWTEWPWSDELAGLELLPAWTPVEDRFAIYWSNFGVSPALNGKLTGDGDSWIRDISADDRYAQPDAHAILWMQAVHVGGGNFPFPAFPSRERAARGEMPALFDQDGGADRWSADAWLLVRQGSTLATGVAPLSYGGNQAGALLRYRLVPGSRLMPTAYARVTGFPSSVSPAELALGLSARPVSGLPVEAQAELRLRERDGRIEARPAVALVGGFDNRVSGFEARGYGQAGYVGGSDATAFADGKLTLQKNVSASDGFRLAVGGGAWGGAQQGGERLDFGPSATMTLAMGELTARMEADYRFRVAGNAAPGSGPALTLSASF